MQLAGLIIEIEALQQGCGQMRVQFCEGNKAEAEAAEEEGDGGPLAEAEEQAQAAVVRAHAGLGVGGPGAFGAVAACAIGDPEHAEAADLREEQRPVPGRHAAPLHAEHEL